MAWATRQEQAEAIAEMEAKQRSLTSFRGAGFGPMGNVARPLADLEVALPKARERLAALDQTIEGLRKTIARIEAALAEPGSSPRAVERARLRDAHLENVKDVERRAVALAAALRTALSSGQAFAASLGSEHPVRAMTLAPFRARASHCLVTTFALDPDRPGAWGAEQLVDLPTSSMEEWMRHGFYTAESKLCDDMLRDARHREGEEDE